VKDDKAAMKTLDVSELIDNIDEVLRVVEEEVETFEITNHGEVIAHLVPVGMPQSTTEAAKRDVWTDLDRLAAEIGAHWPAEISAVDAVRDVRRDLK
jgi:antitoxin (DNA-binding transcriptional repressor) of toxin-antitoxin stability system